MYFIVFYMELFEHWMFKYSSDFNCNESKYFILELKHGVLAQEAIFQYVLYTNPENCQILSRRSIT